jgi:hypothetical protein
MRQGFGRFFDPQGCCSGVMLPSAGVTIQPRPATRQFSTAETGFAQKIVLLQGPIYHIKGAIGGKVK